MGLYRDQLLPRVIDLVLSGDEFGKIRQRVASGLSGEVLEVGFGSGLNVPFYPPAVERVLAVDPALIGRKLARKRVAESRVAIEHVGLDAQALPLPSESVDHVLITWTMCSIPGPVDALAEMRRVLRPSGQLHFAEHGRSSDPKVARWQDRLNPLQRAVAGGCHLNRRIDLLVEGAGFQLAHLDNFYMKGPKVTGYMYVGVATK